MAQTAENGADEPGKMFVGGLSWTTTAETLKAYFSQYGEVEDSVVMYDRQTMRSRGYGYVTMKDPEAVQRVISTRPHIVDGKQIDPKQCCARGTERLIKQCKVFLGGLPLDADEQAIRSFFGQFGKVIEAQVMYDVDKKRSRGFGFVAFDNENPVNQLITQRYVDFNGKQVEIRRLESSAARRRAQGPGGPGGFYGPGPAGGFGGPGYGGPMGPGGQMGPGGPGGPMGPSPYGMYGQQQQWGYGPQYGPATGKWNGPPQMQAAYQWNGSPYGQMTAGPAQGSSQAAQSQGMRAYGATAAPASNAQWGFGATQAQYGTPYQQPAANWQALNASAGGQQRKAYGDYEMNGH